MSLQELVKEKTGLVEAPPETEMELRPGPRHRNVVSWRREETGQSTLEFTKEVQKIPGFESLPEEVKDIINGLNDPDNIELLIPELNEKYGGDFVDSLDHNELKVLAAHMLVEEAVKYCSDHADIEGLTDALIHRIERYEDFEMGDIPGDCDDYVKDKIALAVNAGVPPEKLGFLVVDVNGPDEEGGGHAVLAMENDGEIIIFDNAGQPMTLDDYKDLYPNMEIKFFVSAAPGTEPLIHEDARYAHSLANRYNDREPTPKDELFPRDPDSADTATAQVSAGPVP